MLLIWKGENMKKITLITLSAFVIIMCMILPVTQTIGATTYPYNVKVGDKLNYKVTTLIKGTTAVSADPFGAGFNLSQGDTFQVEIYSIPFPMSNYVGQGIMVRIDKGNLTGLTTFDSYIYHLLHTANKSFWIAFVPNFPDTLISGYTYHNELQNSNNTVFASYTKNSDDKFEFTFDSNTGLLQAFDWYVPSGSFSHLAFSSVSTGLPGFEVPIFIMGIFVTTAIVMHFRRSKS